MSISTPGTDTDHHHQTTTQHRRLIHPPQNIIIAGIQGSGKGTYGKKRLVPREGYTIFEASTEIKKSRFGAEAKAYIERGELVPDEIPMTLLDEHFATRVQVANTLQNGSRAQALQNLEDGVPRTVRQKDMVDALHDKHGLELPIAVMLDVSDETAFSSIKHRAIKEGRMDDANPTAIQNRIETFHRDTSPMLDEFASEGRLIRIDAELGIDLNDPTIPEERVQQVFEEMYARIIDAINNR